MQTTVENIKKNQEHYDQLYSCVNVDSLVAKVSQPEQFLARVKQTGSWFGMYEGAFAERIVNKSVLELGCGDGLNALLMAALGAHVTAIDISCQSEQILRKASAVLGLNNIIPITGEFTQIPFEPASFDFVVGKAFLHHLSHESESEYMRKVARLLKEDGEVRFVEPAVNSKILDTLRWTVPVPGRPSILSRRAFTRWKENDPHPQRDNSSAHYIRHGQRFFNDVKITPYGSIDRFHRLLPRGAFNDRFRQWAHRIELSLPYWFRYPAARAQVVVYRTPKIAR